MKVQPRLVQMRPWWTVAAAAAVVALLLVGQHLYFSGKINKMSQELERNSKQLQQMEENKLTEQPSSLKPMPDSHENGVVEQNAGKENRSETASATQKPIGTNEAIHPQKAPSKSNAGIAEQNKKTNKDGKNPTNKEVGQDLAKEKNGVKDLVNDQEKNAPILQQPIDNQNIAEEPALVKTAEMPKVWPKQIQPLALPTAKLALPNSSIVIAPKLSRSTRIGVHATPMVSELSINDVKDEDRGGPCPGCPGNGKPKAFDTERKIVGQSLSLGLKLEKQVMPRLSLGTGLDYRKLSYEATHKLDLPFKDRDGHHTHIPGHGDNEHEFEYDLNTAVGSISMDLRAVSTDTTIAIADDEEVAAKIHTTQQLSYASLPLYAQYNFGNGRLRLLAKAGVVFNFMLSNQFRVDAVESLNPKFDFRQNDQQGGKASDLQSVTLDYVAGLGLEYRLSKALSLRLEPTVVGSLTSRHNNPNIQSSELSAGLDMGVFYSF